MLKIQQLENENKELRTLLGLQVKLEPSFVNAEIRYELPDVYTDKVVINKGESHELAIGYPVITARGILGQLSRVYNNLCRTYISFRLEYFSSSLLACFRGGRYNKGPG